MFLCDAMLAKLAVWLRIFGYDCELASDEESDDEILERVKIEGRIILTRDKALARDKRCVLIPYDDPKKQMEFVKKRFNLVIPNEPVFRFCSRCNGRLVKDGSKWRCVDCGQEYWKGSHWRRISAFAQHLNNT